MGSVLIVGIDGLQPAQVTPERMPSLSAFASEGVIFANHHSVFPTVTRANVVSMLTGRPPGGHGLAANMLVFPELDPHRAIPALEPELSQVAQRLDKLLLAPVLADILGDHGQQYVGVGIGSSGNSFLQNSNAELSGGATIHPEFCLPRDLHRQVVEKVGPWPEKSPSNEDRFTHAIRIVTDYVIPEREPAVTMLWCSEPDTSQHAAGVGSQLSERALTAADRQLGRLLGWLEDTGRRANTDVIIISDHGYSTIRTSVEVESILREEGFPDGERPGGVVVAPNGGSLLFYVHGGEPAVAERLAGWLTPQPWCGAIVASEAVGLIDGALPASLVGVEGPRAPHLTMSFAWDSEPNEAGFPGHIFGSGRPGVGTHGSMSRHEQRSVLIARGPSFKRGLALDTPSGNVDLAPTVLEVLGVDGGEAMEGRVLQEALADGPDPGSLAWTTEVEKAERPVKGGVYRQEITVSRAGTTTYVDEGRARLEKA